MAFVCLIVSKRVLKVKVMVLQVFFNSLLWMNLAHVAKHQTPFINQAATKPAVPGDEGDMLKSAWLCFILLLSLEEKQQLVVQPCLALMCHPRCSPLRCPPGSIHALWLLLSGDWKQSSLHLQPGFDLGIKSLLCVLFFPKLYCSSWLAGKCCFLPILKQ